MTPAPWTAEATRLRPAWELVAPEPDWRAPIGAWVTAAELEEAGTTLGEIEEAVAFFTATPTLILPAGPGRWRVSSPGYRAGPAGP